MPVDEWLNVTAAVMDGAAVTLRLKTTDGEKLKLMMMRGEGGSASSAAARLSARASKRSRDGSPQTPR